MTPISAIASLVSELTHCPQCGSDMWSNGDACLQFKCGTIVRQGHVTLEHSRCLMAQRGQLTKKLADMRAALEKYEAALVDGPENCTYVMYEECHTAATEALKL